MTDLYRTLGGLALSGLLFAATPVAAGPAHADGEPVTCECPEGIELEGQPWVRLMPPAMPSTAAYLTLRNRTDRDIDIVAGESPVAAVTELHDHVEDAHGVMRMREVAAITIPANGRVELQPGGLHVMLIDLLEPLEAGQVVPITLHLEDHGEIHFEAPVRRGDGSGMPHGSGHHHGGH